VLSDLAALRVAHVVASGRHVASNETMIETIRPDPVALPPASVRVPPLSPADFHLRAAGPRVRLRTVDKPRFTAWGQMDVPVVDGAAVLPEDAILMAVIHRHGAAPAVPVLGVLRHWGTWRGALATTVAHDAHNLVVLGREPVDMATAANALIACQGGVAVASGGQVRALLELPVCGLLSDAPAAEVGEGFARVKRAAEEIVDWPWPLPVVKAAMGASLACNPGPHVTDLGIADGTTGEVFESSIMT
jgi:adenine deaminase